MKLGYFALVLVALVCLLPESSNANVIPADSNEQEEVVKLADLKFALHYHRRVFFQEIGGRNATGNETDTDVTETEIFTETDTTETDTEVVACVEDEYCFLFDSCPTEVSRECCFYLALFTEFNCNNTLMLDCPNNKSVSDFFLDVCAVRVIATTTVTTESGQYNEQFTQAFITTIAQQAQVDESRVNITEVTVTPSGTTQGKQGGDITTGNVTLGANSTIAVTSRTLVDWVEQATQLQQAFSNWTLFTDSLNKNLKAQKAPLLATQALSYVFLENDPLSSSPSPSTGASPSPSASTLVSSAPSTSHAATASPSVSVSGSNNGAVKLTGSAGSVTPITALQVAGVLALMLAFLA